MRYVCLSPKFPEKNDFTSADSCGYRACCQANSGREILLLCSPPFFKPYNGRLFFVEILSSPVLRIWPFAASVTTFEGSEDFSASYKPRDCDLHSRTVRMARKMPARDQIVKLIVGAGQASPSPPVGPALGSKGVKSMDFCKVPTFCIRSGVGQ